MNRLTTALVLVAVGANTVAARKDTLRVDMLRIAGPFARQIVMTTTDKDANDKPYDQDNLQWDMPMDMDMWKRHTDDAHTLHATDSIGFIINSNGLYQLGFTVDNNIYSKVSFIVKANSKYALYIDDKPQSGEVALIPGRHDCVLKLQHKGENADTVEIKLATDADTTWTAPVSYTHLTLPTT